MAGELVVGYELRESTDQWTATAAASPRDSRMSGPPSMDPMGLLLGDLPLTSDERQMIDGHAARALVAPFEAGSTQALWLDVDSLLPLRWELRAPGAPADVLAFSYMPLNLLPPPNVTRPMCVQ